MIKVGFCVAYDWALLKYSLPRVYDHADRICLSLDANRRSWSGRMFSFDTEKFFDWLNSVDHKKKIVVYQDNFSQPDLSPIENDNRQRRMMAEFLGDGGWHVQVDCDEYFFDFKAFVDTLKRIKQNPSGREKPLNVCCNWISVFKSVDNGYLVIENPNFGWESMPFATNRPEYLNARRNSHFNYFSNSFVLHETWARDEMELREKINSWGHNLDFLSKDSYLNFWKSLDKFNYKYVRDFHPLKSGVWESLNYVEADGKDTLIAKLQARFTKEMSSASFFKNSRLVRKLTEWSKFK